MNDEPTIAEHPIRELQRKVQKLEDQVKVLMEWMQTRQEMEETNWQH